MARDRTADQLADELAAQQHGAISRRQALKVELTPHQVAHRLASGRWLHATRGVFVVAAVPGTWQQSLMVACLSGHPGTCASHLSAAALLGLVRAAAGRAAQAPGRKGLPLIEEALEVWSTGRRPDSPPEMKLFRLMVEWGFPGPQRQHPVFDTVGQFVGRGDVAVPAWRLILEYDGQEFHGPRSKAADAARQSRLEALGWTVLRVTKNDLRRPGRLRARLQTLAAARTAA
ncbi:MAG: DUF559 domain-containing protein [Acidimicrobiia bacterium]